MQNVGDDKKLTTASAAYHSLTSRPQARASSLITHLHLRGATGCFIFGETRRRRA